MKMSTKLPRFETEEQVREFWAGHDSTEYFDELEELPEGVTMLLPRHTITLRLDEAVLERLRRLAAVRFRQAQSKDLVETGHNGSFLSLADGGEPWRA